MQANRTADGSVTVTITPEQAPHIAEALYFLAGNALACVASDCELKGRDDIRQMRDILDRYEPWIEIVEDFNPEVSTEAHLTLPRTTLQAVVDYLLDFDGHKIERPEDLNYWRREMEHAEAGLPLLEAVR